MNTFSSPNTPPKVLRSKERPGNLKAFCEILYPPQGGLNEVLVQKATKALMGVR